MADLPYFTLVLSFFEQLRIGHRVPVWRLNYNVNPNAVRRGIEPGDVYLTPPLRVFPIRRTSLRRQPHRPHYCLRQPKFVTPPCYFRRRTTNTPSFFFTPTPTATPTPTTDFRPPRTKADAEKRNLVLLRYRGPYVHDVRAEWL